MHQRDGRYDTTINSTGSLPVRSPSNAARKFHLRYEIVFNHFNTGGCFRGWYPKPLREEECPHAHPNVSTSLVCCWRKRSPPPMGARNDSTTAVTYERPTIYLRYCCCCWRGLLLLPCCCCCCCHRLLAEHREGKHDHRRERRAPSPPFPADWHQWPQHLRGKREKIQTKPSIYSIRLYTSTYIYGVISYTGSSTSTAVV